VTESARNLGVVTDTQTTMCAHVYALCQTGFYQLGQLRPVVWALTSEAAMTLVHAVILCRLDYCNSLSYGMFCVPHAKSEVSTERPLRAALPDHGGDITSIQCCTSFNGYQSSWVHYRVQFKITSVIHQELLGQVPTKLSIGDDVHLIPV